MKKPDKETQIRMALCPECKMVIFASVLHLMDDNGKQELANLVMDGCDVKTIPLLEYRKKPIGWCYDPKEHLKNYFNTFMT